MEKTDIKIMVLIIILVILVVIIPGYYSECRQAKIYNQEHNTNYTCGDFFWAGDQINQQSQTININK